ncbi:uncharacterized protein LOC142827399 [Pelodiscus sinensis]|uniref:uncharacterized protein LOC142827399 n=1 Tax=Pelodiscus sinensis TaxID=13735 RepID=UPI003F6BCB1F
MEPWVVMCLLGPLLGLYKCLQLIPQAGTLLFMNQEAEIALDSLTRKAMAVVWHQHPTVVRPVWSLDSSTDWWDRVVLGLWDDQQWLRNFRMRKRTFQQLCTWLTPALQRATTRLRAPIPVNKRVTIALWKLATPDSYRSVAQQFGVVHTINIVERSGEAFLPAWIVAKAQTFEQPHTAAVRQARQDAVRIREALVDMFAQTP